MAAEAETVARRIYRETARFYADIEPRLGDHGHGFKILYGPPSPVPEILFIGYQPGGGREDRAAEIILGAEKRWPRICEYAHAGWTLASNLRRMFGADFLQRCSGLNALFFRAPNAGEYKRIGLGERREIASFCLPRVVELVETIQPRRVVCIGFEALRLFGPTRSILPNASGRSLVETGSIGAREVLAVMHLSGAQMSNEDRAAIASYVLKSPRPRR